MLSITDLKTGVTIDMEGQPFIVESYQHSKMGRAGAVLRTKLRNLKTGSVVDLTFKGGDKFEEAVLDKHSCTYLYAEGNQHFFMDSVSFEQYNLSATEVGPKARFLKEGLEVQILFYESKPVSVILPIKIDLLVTHTEPGVKGDTVSGGTKPATLETGATISVPLFIKNGEIIRVNTEEGTYVERAKS